MIGFLVHLKGKNPKNPSEGTGSCSRARKVVYFSNDIVFAPKRLIIWLIISVALCKSRCLLSNVKDFDGKKGIHFVCFIKDDRDPSFNCSSPN